MHDAVGDHLAPIIVPFDALDLRHGRSCLVCEDKVARLEARGKSVAGSQKFAA
jgi:hypothetical protein